MNKTLYRTAFPTKKQGFVDFPSFEITLGSYTSASYTIDLLPFARIKKDPSGYVFVVGWLLWDILFIYDNGDRPF